MTGAVVLSRTGLDDLVAALIADGYRVIEEAAHVPLACLGVRGCDLTSRGFSLKLRGAGLIGFKPGFGRFHRAAPCSWR
jgi:hypothetical protein